jgi:hypothetical protein
MEEIETGDNGRESVDKLLFGEIGCDMIASSSQFHSASPLYLCF